MTREKRLAIISLFGGAGMVLMSALIYAGIVWYKSRPVHTKPWDIQAITASFDDIDIEGQDQALVFYYILKNNTATDYIIPAETSIDVMAKQKEENGLVSDKSIKLDIPKPIPAGQSLRIAIHLVGLSRVTFYSSPLRGALDNKYKENRKSTIIISPKEAKSLKLDEAATLKDEQNYIQAPSDFVKKNMGNLNGFVIYDKTNRYQIDLPYGW